MKKKNEIEKNTGCVKHDKKEKPMEVSKCAQTRQEREPSAPMSIVMHPNVTTFMQGCVQMFTLLGEIQGGKEAPKEDETGPLIQAHCLRARMPPPVVLQRFPWTYGH